MSESKASIPVLSPLKHDGKWYRPGDTVELTKKEWLDLRDTGAVPAGPTEEELEQMLQSSSQDAEPDDVGKKAKGKSAAPEE